MDVIFWSCTTLIMFSYVIYPFLLVALARTFGERDNYIDVSQVKNWPEVAVVIAAFNEESCIKERIENLLLLDYPEDKISIYIGSDGSTDQTNNILSSFEEVKLNIILFEMNRGKANVINDLLINIKQPITIFSDANTMFETDALKQLSKHFTDEDIGAVCGELNLFNPDGNSNKDSAYWKYEQLLKKHEGQLDALLGANGAIYAIRTSLYQPIATNTIVDDFLIVMNVAKKGFKVVYDTKAIAHEEVAPNIAEESKRRIRIGTGNYQAFTQLYWLLNPFKGWRSFTYISHKVLRWFTPHMMVICFIANIFLLGTATFNLFMLIQVLGYCVAFWGISKSNAGDKIPTSIAFLAFFVSMNLALLKGFYQFIFKNVSGTWQRTTR